jgi:hypothetical protein
MSGEDMLVGPKTAQALRDYLAGPWQDREMPTEERVDTMIARLSMATKERPLSDDEAAERLTLFWRVLRDLPVVDLAAGFDYLLKTKTFMPTPAEVFAACNLHQARREFRKHRARVLIRQHESDWRAPIPDTERVTPEEFQALMAGIKIGGEA